MKSSLHNMHIHRYFVALRGRAWIEIKIHRPCYPLIGMSPSAGGRGLKYLLCAPVPADNRVALRGRAWIEIISDDKKTRRKLVALRGRAWIEITECFKFYVSHVSRPPREGVD